MSPLHPGLTARPPAGLRSSTCGTKEVNLIVSLLCLCCGRHCPHHTALCLAVCLPSALAVHLQAQVIGSPVGTVSCPQLGWGSVPTVTPREEATCHTLFGESRFFLCPKATPGGKCVCLCLTWAQQELAQHAQQMAQ